MIAGSTARRLSVSRMLRAAGAPRPCLPTGLRRAALLSACFAIVTSGARADECGGWSGFGPGIGGTDEQGPPSVHATVSVSLGGGHDLLLVGGEFRSPATQPRAESLIAWDGAAWLNIGDMPMPSGVTGDYRVVTAIVDMAGTAIGGVVVGGRFDRIRCPMGSPFCDGDVNAGAIARWDGSRWYPLGAGMVGPYKGIGAEVSGAVRVGEEVWAWGSGSFVSNSGEQIWGFARWDGQDWRPIDGWNWGTADPEGICWIQDVCVVGERVFVLSDRYLQEPRLKARTGAQWDDVACPSHSFTSWRSMAVHDDGHGPRLHVFVSAPSSGGPLVPNNHTLVQAAPDPNVVTDAALRQRIQQSGWAWRVRGGGSGMEMLLVPPGTYQMGCSASGLTPCEADEQPVHSVTLTKPFYLSRYEVTQAQWQAVMGSNPSHNNSASPEVPANQVPNRPVEMVSWDAAQSFLSASGLRLPTEAEWEYACRAGTTTAFNNGSDSDATGAGISWFLPGAANQTRPVGLKSANRLGFHDMHGNVAEWVSDWFSPDYYASSPPIDPAGPPAPSIYGRAYRGGSYGNSFVRSSDRWNHFPYFPASSSTIGFRAALSIGTLELGNYTGVARLDGEPGSVGAWTALGTPSDIQWPPTKLQSIPAGPFRGLYMVGAFQSVDGRPCPFVARHVIGDDGSPQWRFPFGTGLPMETYLLQNAVRTLCGWRDSLVIGGRWEGIRGERSAPDLNCVAAWEAGSGRWGGDSAPPSLGGTVLAFAAPPPCPEGVDCSGWPLHGAVALAAGWIPATSTTSSALNHVHACVPGLGWRPVSSNTSSAASGFNAAVNALVSTPDGPLEPGVFAGGAFTRADGIDASRVARWSGTAWQRLGAGLDGTVWSLAAHDDGSGPAVYAGGSFGKSGPLPARRVARCRPGPFGWDAPTWEPVGSGMDGGTVYVLRVLDDGSGPALFAGGSFVSSGGTTLNRVARWNGSSWMPLGAGTDGTVLALEQVDLGGRRLIVAAGSFTQAGGQPANRVAAWDAAAGSWAPLGDGMDRTVHALASLTTSSGPRLYASGLFTQAGGVPAARCAEWDGAAWSPMGGGLGGGALAMHAVSRPGERSILVGGSFTSGANGTEHVAMWSACAPACLQDLDGDLFVDGNDLGQLLSAWGTGQSADFTGDGIVDGDDLGVLLGSWGPCG